MNEHGNKNKVKNEPHGEIINIRIIRQVTMFYNSGCVFQEHLMITFDIDINMRNTILDDFAFTK